MQPNELTPVQKAERQYTLVTAETCRRSLRKFVKRAWGLIDPKPFVDAWHTDCICDHLAFVALGDIQSLMINIPPRMTKSSIVSVAYPAWTWTNEPEIQFLCASYQKDLAEGDAIKMRRIVESEWYRARYPHVILLGDQNRVDDFRNSDGGYRQTISVGGVTTGKGGDIQCFPAEELVHTQTGLRAIGDLVEQRQRLRVWSADTITGELSLQPITAWHRNPGRPIVEVGFSDGARLRCTPDHRIWTARGWAEAQDLRPWDVCPTFPVPNVQDGPFVDPEAFSPSTGAFLGAQNVPDLRFAQTGTVVAGARIGGQTVGASNHFPIGAASEPPDHGYPDPVPLSQHRSGFDAAHDRDNLFAGQFGTRMDVVAAECAVPLGVLDVLLARTVGQIAQPIVRWLAVAVANFLARWDLAAKGQHHGLVDEHDPALAALAGVEARIASLTGRGLEDTPSNAVYSPGDVRDRDSGFAADSPEAGHAVQTFVAGNRQPTFVRHVGETPVTYCLTVERNHTFLVGRRGVLVANCLDDPHNAFTVESDAIRKSTIQWHDNAWRSRVNDPNKARRIYIGQRTHDGDVFGHVLAVEGQRWTHLNLAMEFDGSSRCITYRNRGEGPIGEPIFKDPRTKPNSLLCPARFDEKTAEREKAAISARTWNAQYQQRPEGIGGVILKRKWWRRWEWPEWHPQYHKSERPLPELLSVLQSYDTAFEEGEQDSYTCRTTWGLFEHADVIRRPNGQTVELEPKIHAMLLERRNWRPSFGALVDDAVDSNNQWEPDRILVEKKASGHSLVQELRRKGLLVRAVKVQGDLVYRAHLSSLPLEKGSIWYMQRNWAMDLIEQCAKFPRVDFDDQVASCCIAWMYLRRYMDLQIEDDEDTEELELFNPRILQNQRAGYYG